MPSIKLASLTGSHDFRGVGHGGGPVEALSEGISYQRPRRGVVAASPRVYVLQELDSFLMWDATVDAKLICKHKGLIPDSNVKACQPI